MRLLCFFGREAAGAAQGVVDEPLELAVDRAELVGGPFLASSMSHWSWPLIERNSSAAHFSRASIVSASMRSTKLLVFDCSFAILFLSFYW